MKTLVFFVFLFFFYAFSSISFAQTSKTWDFSKDNTTFIDQTYTCGCCKEETVHFQSITLFEKNRFTIIARVGQKTIMITEDIISDLNINIFTGRRTIVTKDGCEFNFFVTGKTPKEIADFFKKLYYHF